MGKSQPNVSVLDNRIERRATDSFATVAAGGGVRWEGNVWDDDGTPATLPP